MPSGAPAPIAAAAPTAADVAAVAALLGRTPRGAFEVAVRDGATGAPLVIRNAPLLDDGTPMPTRYWLADRRLAAAVSRLESAGGVRAAEAAVDPDQLAAAHAAYAAERDAVVPREHAGPRPFGGVGGTRRGVKCLHAHYAAWLAGLDDPVGAWVDARLAETEPHARPVAHTHPPAGPRAVTRVGAVDIGTNSVRLLVADLDGGAGADGAAATDPRALALTTLDRRMRITRLGQGVDGARALAPDAIDRTVSVLAEYGSTLRDLGVTQVRAAATSAARDAANRDDFFDRAEAALGVRPELLSGDEEARLSFLGATAGLRGEPTPYLVVDIGGGSTEIVVGTGEPQGAMSIDVGCVRLTEQYLHDDPPSPEQLSQAVSVVRDHLADVTREIPATRTARTLVGLAGTVTTVAAVEQGVDYSREAIHHFRLTRAAAEDVFRTLATESRADRAHNPGLERERVDVIVGGAIVLVAVMRHFEFDALLVSEDDILDGLARSLA